MHCMYAYIHVCMYGQCTSTDLRDLMYVCMTNRSTRSVCMYVCMYEWPIYINRSTWPYVCMHICMYIVHTFKIHTYMHEYGYIFCCMWKAPQGYAFGFTHMVQKLIVIVQLLMGEIPERSLFNQVRIYIYTYILDSQYVCMYVCMYVCIVYIHTATCNVHTYCLRSIYVMYV